MSERYPKIQSLYKRDPKTHKLILGKYTTEEFEYLASNKWVFTEKVDGTNIRLVWSGTSVRILGRTDRAQIPAGLMQRFTDDELHDLPRSSANLAEALADIFGDYPAVLFGEGYGLKIQKGGSYRKDQGFILFDVWADGHWFTRIQMQEVGDHLGFKLVPVVLTGTLHDMERLCRDGFESTVAENTKCQAEGLVGVPAVPVLDGFGNRIIVKLKHKDMIKAQTTA